MNEPDSTASSQPSGPRPGTQPSAPSTSHYAVELPYAEELQALLEGRYIVESFLGQGGMGAVYKGLQLPLKRPVAIKILAKQQAGVEDEFDFEERFKREAYAMAALTHPNIVQVYDCGDAGENFLFISMELVEGGDLSQMIKVGGVTPEVALGMIGPICDGLAAAHDRGLVHRDIKPANIFLTIDGKPKVADFGLAKKFDVKSTFMTKTGLGMGTPDYAAPEQYEGVSDIDHRADIYALGVMFYQMLTGSLPRGAYKAPSQRVPIDPRLDDVVQKAMEQDRAERYQNVLDLKNEVQQILATWMQGPPPEPTPASLPETSIGTSPRSATSSISRVQRPTPATPRSGALPQPPPEKKGSGMILVVLAAAVIGGGAFFLLRKPQVVEDQSPSETTAKVDTASTTPASAPSPQKDGSPTPGPAPTTTPPASTNTLGFGPAVIRSGPVEGFSNFAPTAKWRSGFADDQSWGKGWVRRGNEMIMADNSPGRNAMFLFAEKFQACGLRLRYRSSPSRSFLDLIQRLQKEGYGPRYTVTLWSGGNLNPTIDLLPRKKDGNRRTLIRSEKTVVIGNKEEHTAEFYAVGDQLTVFFDGVQVVTLKDTAFNEGYPGIFIGSGTEILGVEAADLSGVTLANAPSQDSPAAAPPVQMGGGDKGWVDLLARANVTRDSLLEPWTLENGVLRSPMEPRGPNSKEGHTTFVFPMEVPLKSYDVRLRLVREAPGYGLILGFFRDSEESMLRVGGQYGFSLEGMIKNKEKTWFPVGEVHEMKLEVREASVRAYFDGQLLVDHAGELPTMKDTFFFNHQPRKPNWLTVGVCMGRISVQEASFRVVDGVSQEQSKTMVADPRLAQLEKGFRSRLENDVEVSHRADVANLNQSYLANGLPRARQAAQGRGSLVEVEALDAEKARMEKGEPMPLEDAPDLAPSLKSLRDTYRGALAKLDADRAKKAVPLYDLYIGALNTYVVELTKANRLEEAKKVQSLLDNLMSEKALLQGKAAEPAISSATVTPKGAPASDASGGKEDGVRPSLRAAEYLVKNGGSCVALMNGQRIEIKGEADMPSRRFDLHEIGFDRLNSSMPLPVAKDFEAFAGLKELRRVWIRVPNSKLTDHAYSWLAGNEELDFLHLENAGDLTTTVLDYLMSSKKLTYLSIQYAPRFSGEGLEKLPCVATVDKADFLSTGFSDKGLLGISAYTKLRELRITAKGTMTDKGLAVLGKLTNLEKLLISESDFGEAAAEAIAKLEKLQELDLANTALNDKGLKKLKSLKTLKALNLRGCKVTAKGVEDFKAEVGSCLVTY